MLSVDIMHILISKKRKFDIMKRLIILIGIILLSTIAKAQFADSTSTMLYKAYMDAGNMELQKYTNTYYTGMGITAGGGLVALLGLNSTHESASTITLTGSAFMFVGGIVMFFSHGHIKNAGIYFDKANRLIIPIGK